MPILRRSFGWVLLLFAALLLVWSNPLAESAAGFNREVTVGSTALYGTLRVMNSVMSVAKDADVTGGVGVASVTASPGQLLQPVTNTIDRMAELLFWLAILSGVLAALFLPVAQVASAGLVVGAVVGTGLALAGRSLPPRAHQLGRAAMILCLFGAVLLPGAYALAFAAGDRMTDQAWSSATAVFDRLRGTYDDAAVAAEIAPGKSAMPAAPAEPAPVDEEQSVFGRIGSALTSSGQALTGTVTAASDVVDMLAEGMISRARIVSDGVAISGELFSASIAIAVSYLIRILVLPIMILAAALILLRAALR